MLWRNLFGPLRTGEEVNPEWALFSYPPRWHYGPSTKATEGCWPAWWALRIRGWPKRSNMSAPDGEPDGHWLLENTHADTVPLSRFEEPDGTPSRWNTLRALHGAALVRRVHPHPGSAGQAFDHNRFATKQGALARARPAPCQAPTAAPEPRAGLRHTPCSTNSHRRHNSASGTQRHCGCEDRLRSLMVLGCGW